MVAVCIRCGGLQLGDKTLWMQKEMRCYWLYCIRTVVFWPWWNYASQIHPKGTTNCKTDPEEGHSGECSFFLTCKENETVSTALLLSTHIPHSPEFALHHLFLSPKFNFLLHRKKFHEPRVERMVSFMVTPCINNAEPFYYQLMHIMLKNRVIKIF